MYNASNEKLNELYIDIDANADNYEHLEEIAKLFQELRDLKLNENENDEAKIAQWELDFFNFTIMKGELYSLCSMVNKDGATLEYPSLDNFNEETYEYLIERLNNSNNPLIKAQYSTILWKSPKRHGKYAKIAVDSFLELIKIYEEKDKEEIQKSWGYKAFQSAENAYRIGLSSKYKINDVKLEIIRLIKSFNPKSRSSFVLKLRLIELMLEEKKNFNKDDFSGLENVCLEVYNDLIEKGEFHDSIMILELGEKIDKKRGTNTYNWRKSIAEMYESLMEKASSADNFLALDFCLDALENYKKINDTIKIEELKKKYSEINENTKLKKVTFQLKDYQKHLNEIKNYAEEISELDSIEIIGFLMYGNKVLLPSFKNLDELTDKIIQDFPILAMCSKVNLDPRGHPAEHFVTEDDKKYHEIIRNYRYFLEMVTEKFLFFLFIAAIQKGKLSGQIIIDFLKKESWIGREWIKKVNGRDIKYNWITLVAPSIYAYFNQMAIYLLNPNVNISNFILCIDSLVLKLEGIIRDFCTLNGITTYTTFKENKQIVRERPLNKLLNDEKLEKILGKDDLLFLKFLLIEQGGYNLRNEIAHSLISMGNYNINNIHLLLLAFFRLAKYQVKNDSL